MIGSHFIRSGTLWIIALLMIMLAGCEKKIVDPEQLLAQAKQERMRGDINTASIHLKNVLQVVPDHAEARYLLGMNYNESADYKSAEPELRKAMALQYDPAQIMPALGKSLLMQGEYQKVLNEVAVKSTVDKSIQAEVTTVRALALIGMGRTPDGRKMLDDALALRPDYAEALLAKARLAIAENNIEETGRLVDRALASNPKHAGAWVLKGDLLQATNDKNGATAAYTKAVELQPQQTIVARVNLFGLYLSAGNLEDAKKQLDETRKVSAGSPLINYMQAMMEFRNKNYKAAEEQLQQVLKLDANHYQSLVLAGAVQSVLGSHAQAQVMLKRALDIAPGAILPRKLLAASLAKTGQVQRGVEVLQPLLQAGVQDPSLLGLAGELYLQNNDMASAEQYFQKALKLDPKDPTTRTALGVSRMVSGAGTQALSELASATQVEGATYHPDMLLAVLNLQRGNYADALKAVEALEQKQSTLR